TSLPMASVFVDLIAYTRFETVRNKDGKASEKRIPTYVAFLLAPCNREDEKLVVKRVELGEAGPIDNAIADWRRAIELRQDDHAAAAKIQETVWSKIVAQVPSGTKTLYIAPDGHFSRVPWAALPIGKNRVLLDEYAVTVVPHGRFLLEHLRFPRSFLGPE